MIDIGLALTWAALSAASAKGLTVLARTAASSDAETDSTMPTVEASALLGGLRSIGAAPAPAGEPR